MKTAPPDQAVQLFSYGLQAMGEPHLPISGTQADLDFGIEVNRRGGVRSLRMRAPRGFVLLAAAISSVAVLLVGCERTPPEPQVDVSEPLAAWETEPLFNENGVYIAHGNGKALFVAELGEGDHAVCINAPGRTGGYGYWIISLVQVTVRRGGDGPNFAFYTPSLDMFTPTQILAAGDGTTTFEVKADRWVRWLIRVEALDRHRERGGCPPLSATR